MHIVTSALLLAAGVAQPALADTILFQEDFESYGERSAVGGTGGWTGMGLVGTGAGLGSKTFNGQLYPSATLNWASNYFAPEGLSSSAIYRLSFDTYAYATNPVTHNAGLYFHDSRGGTGAIHIGWYYNSLAGNNLGWAFDVRGLRNDNSNWIQYLSPSQYPSSVNNPVNLSVILDPSKNEVYGLAKFGGQVVETSHFLLTDEQLSVIDGITIHQDIRQPRWYQGADFDNILVTATPISASATTVPEPSLLLGITVVAGGVIMQRKKHSQPD
ncbi:PEP-CTERM sorting domain-containing protein [[Phormidium] sp. ETS-05]|uniref:PEP-CTERM sorting domain-containing protein n=1 Tax=[Phormidium] sp. ETS-05 TaxID=222819 RepID=UPI0018EF2CBC|nr:PEP-CTERM sorting domain-containing protein [[Phormidium] sp. ETS-05]